MVVVVGVGNETLSAAAAVLLVSGWTLPPVETAAPGTTLLLLKLEL